MHKISKTNEYRTSDLYLAAYLLTAGVEMVRHDRDGTRVYFVFDTSMSNIEELKQAWVNNTGKVAAQPFSFNIKGLKSLCHLS